MKQQHLKDIMVQLKDKDTSSGSDDISINTNRSIVSVNPKIDSIIDKVIKKNKQKSIADDLSYEDISIGTASKSKAKKTKPIIHIVK